MENQNEDVSTNDLTSTMGSVFSTSEESNKKSPAPAVDLLPTSSSDANKVDLNSSEKSPEDPISSSSDVMDCATIEPTNKKSGITHQIKPFTKSVMDNEVDIFANLSQIPTEKITENVEDIVSDLENLLGEPSDFSMPSSNKISVKDSEIFDDMMFKEPSFDFKSSNDEIIKTKKDNKEEIVSKDSTIEEVVIENANLSTINNENVAIDTSEVATIDNDVASNVVEVDVPCSKLEGIEACSKLEGIEATNILEEKQETIEKIESHENVPSNINKSIKETNLKPTNLIDSVDTIVDKTNLKTTTEIVDNNEAIKNTESTITKKIEETTMEVTSNESTALENDIAQEVDAKDIKSSVCLLISRSVVSMETCSDNTTKVVLDYNKTNEEINTPAPTSPKIEHTNIETAEMVIDDQDTLMETCSDNINPVVCNKINEEINTSSVPTLETEDVNEVAEKMQIEDEDTPMETCSENAIEEIANVDPNVSDIKNEETNTAAVPTSEAEDVNTKAENVIIEDTIIETNNTSEEITNIDPNVNEITNEDIIMPDIPISKAEDINTEAEKVILDEDIVMESKKIGHIEEDISSKTNTEINTTEVSTLKTENTNEDGDKIIIEDKDSTMEACTDDISSETVSGDTCIDDKKEEIEEPNLKVEEISSNILVEEQIHATETKSMTESKLFQIDDSENIIEDKLQENCADNMITELNKPNIDDITSQESNVLLAVSSIIEETNENVEIIEEKIDTPTLVNEKIEAGIKICDDINIDKDKTEESIKLDEVNQEVVDSTKTDESKSLIMQEEVPVLVNEEDISETTLCDVDNKVSENITDVKDDLMEISSENPNENVETVLDNEAHLLTPEVPSTEGTGQEEEIKEEEKAVTEVQTPEVPSTEQTGKEEEIEEEDEAQTASKINLNQVDNELSGNIENEKEIAMETCSETQIVESTIPEVAKIDQTSQEDEVKVKETSVNEEQIPSVEIELKNNDQQVTSEEEPVQENSGIPGSNTETPGSEEILPVVADEVKSTQIEITENLLTSNDVGKEERDVLLSNTMVDIVPEVNQGVQIDRSQLISTNNDVSQMESADSNVSQLISSNTEIQKDINSENISKVEEVSCVDQEKNLHSEPVVVPSKSPVASVLNNDTQDDLPLSEDTKIVVPTLIKSPEVECTISISSEDQSKNENLLEKSITPTLEANECNLIKNNLNKESQNLVNNENIEICKSGSSDIPKVDEESENTLIETDLPKIEVESNNEIIEAIDNPIKLNSEQELNTMHEEHESMEVDEKEFESVTQESCIQEQAMEVDSAEMVDFSENEPETVFENEVTTHEDIKEDHEKDLNDEMALIQAAQDSQKRQILEEKAATESRTSIDADLSSKQKIEPICSINSKKEPEINSDEMALILAAQESQMREDEEIKLNSPKLQIKEVPEVKLSSPKLQMSEVPEVKLNSPKLQMRKDQEVKLSSPKLKLREVQDVKLSSPKLQIKEVKPSSPKLQMKEVQEIKVSSQESQVKEVQEIKQSSPIKEVNIGVKNQNVITDSESVALKEPLNIVIDNVHSSSVSIKEAQSTTNDKIETKDLSSEIKPEYSSKISQSQELKLTITKNKNEEEPSSILKICDLQSTHYTTKEVMSPVTASEREETPIPKLIIKQSQCSPKLLSPLKITIKPVLKPEEQQKSSPKLIIKPIVKPEDEMKLEEKHHSPKITIKHIPKPSEDGERSHSPKITIKPIIKPLELNNTKLKIKPIIKPDDIKEDLDGDEEMKERIVLKINKGNISQKEVKKVDENEKLATIKVKLSKQGAHIVNKGEEKSLKRSNDLTNAEGENKKQKLEVPEVTLFLPKENPEVPDVEIVETPSIPLIDLTVQAPIVTPKKRGRPRKVPLEVREDFKETPVESTSGRPKRSCRGPSVKTTLGIKPRKPRGTSLRGRPPGRGATRVRGGKVEKPLKKEKIKESKLKLLKEAALTARVSESLENQDIDMKIVDDDCIIIEDSSNEKISPTKEESKVEKFEPQETLVKSDVVMYEEETRMSAETNSRAQTPAKQVVLAPTSQDVEESQSSTATSESIKVQRRHRLEFEQEPGGSIVSADQLAEYYWANGGPYMLQEQVAQFLGIKSFKRKYPGIQRRPVDMQERDFIRESGLVTENMCDLGLTAVNSSDILDIMYTDFQHKYEEYCKHQRDRLTKDITNKQKALSLAASQEKTKFDIMQQAVESAAHWNSSFNKTRKDQRRACMDLQTMTINFPKGRCKQINRPKLGNYPIALVPGQFTDYYKTFTPTELNNLPLNTMLYEPINFNHDEDSQSDGSGSDSDTSSSGSDSSDSDSSDDDCKLCNTTSIPKKAVV